MHRRCGFTKTWIANRLRLKEANNHNHSAFRLLNDVEDGGEDLNEGQNGYVLSLSFDINTKLGSSHIHTLSDSSTTNGAQQSPYKATTHLDHEKVQGKNSSPSANRRSCCRDFEDSGSETSNTSSLNLPAFTAPSSPLSSMHTSDSLLPPLPDSHLTNSGVASDQASPPSELRRVKELRTRNSYTNADTQLYQSTNLVPLRSLPFHTMSCPTTMTEYYQQADRRESPSLWPSARNSLDSCRLLTTDETVIEIIDMYEKQFFRVPERRAKADEGRMRRCRDAPCSDTFSRSTADEDQGGDASFEPTQLIGLVDNRSGHTTLPTAERLSSVAPVGLRRVTHPQARHDGVSWTALAAAARTSWYTSGAHESETSSTCPEAQNPIGRLPAIENPLRDHALPFHALTSTGIASKPRFQAKRLSERRSSQGSIDASLGVDTKPHRFKKAHRRSVLGGQFDRTSCSSSNEDLKLWPDQSSLQNSSSHMHNHNPEVSVAGVDTQDLTPEIFDDSTGKILNSISKSHRLDLQKDGVRRSLSDLAHFYNVLEASSSEQSTVHQNVCKFYSSSHPSCPDPLEVPLKLDFAVGDIDEHSDDPGALMPHLMDDPLTSDASDSMNNILSFSDDVPQKRSPRPATLLSPLSGACSAFSDDYSSLNGKGWQWKRMLTKLRWRKPFEWSADMARKRRSKLHRAMS